MRISVFLLLLAPTAAVCVLGWPCSAKADYIGQANVGIYENAPYPYGSSSFNPTNLFSKQFNASDPKGFDFSSNNAFAGPRGDSGSYALRAEGGNGSIGVSATVTATGSDTATNSGFVSSLAELEDSKTFYVTNPSDPLTVHSHLNLKGSLSSTATSTGTAEADLFVVSSGLTFDIPPLTYKVSDTYAYSDTYPGKVSERFPSVHNEPQTVAQAAPGTIPVTEHVFPGVPHSFSFEMALELEANGVKYDDSVVDCPCQVGTALASGAFADTLSWGGIDSVIDDVTGSPVTGWTVTSASGFDYSKPAVEPNAAVPEPPSAALLLTALAGFCALGRVACRRGAVAAI